MHTLLLSSVPIYLGKSTVQVLINQHVVHQNVYATYRCICQSTATNPQVAGSYGQCYKPQAGRKQTNTNNNKKNICHRQPLCNDTQTHPWYFALKSGWIWSKCPTRTAPHNSVHHNNNDSKSHSWSNLHGLPTELTPGISEAVSADEVIKHPHLTSHSQALWVVAMFRWHICSLNSKATHMEN